jgi:hypothetical protein
MERARGQILAFLTGAGEKQDAAADAAADNGTDEARGN